MDEIIGTTMGGWGWIKKWSKDYKPYWYNSITKECVWIN